jgi:hypothetical protein
MVENNIPFEQFEMTEEDVENTGNTTAPETELETEKEEEIQAKANQKIDKPTNPDISKNTPETSPLTVQTPAPVPPPPPPELETENPVQIPAPIQEPTDPTPVQIQFETFGQIGKFFRKYTKNQLEGWLERHVSNQ